MNRRLVIPVLALTLLGGCIVHTPPARSHAVARKQSRCHPSEYWDGDRCVHKSKKKKHKDHDRDRGHGRHRHRD